MTLPLPIYHTVEIGTLADKAGKTLTVLMGLSEDLVRQLRERSLDMTDTDLQENSSDYKRFGEGSYETWYAKSRTPFAVVDPLNGALAAIAWLGPKPFGRDSLKHLSAEEAGQDERALNASAGDWHTISFRSYPGYRGTGFMKEFVRIAVGEYRKHFPNAKIWAITDRKNEGSMRLIQSFGLTVVEESPEGRVTLAEA